MKSTHGLGHLDEYVIWCGIKQRCFNPKCKEYRLYGARGIILCDAWKHDFKAFYEYIGPRPTKHHSIDRIDSNGNYEPGNVRWATHLEQANNVRSNTILTCRGESKTMAEWARSLGIAYDMLCQRVCKLGWSHEKAILTPKLFT